MDFTDIKEVLQIYIIDDLSDIIISYLNKYIFINDFFEIMRENDPAHRGNYDIELVGKYYFSYDRNNQTFLHYLLSDACEYHKIYYYRDSIIRDIIKNASSRDLKNRNDNGDTELHKLCNYWSRCDIGILNITNIIKNCKLNINNFQSRNYKNETELWNLCKYYKWDDILNLINIKGYKICHFLIDNINGINALDIICQKEQFSPKMIEILLKLEIRVKHLQHMDRDGRTTIFYNFCCNFTEPHLKNVITKSKLKLSYFMNNDRHGRVFTLLCRKKMYGIIIYLINTLKINRNHFLQKVDNCYHRRGESIFNVLYNHGSNETTLYIIKKYNIPVNIIINSNSIAHVTLPDIKYFVETSGLKIEHFQKENNYLLRYFIEYNKYDIIKYLSSALKFKPIHFLNKYYMGDTELFTLINKKCYYLIKYLIKEIDLKYCHFLIKNNYGKTGLSEICNNLNDENIIYLFDNLHFKWKHFISFKPPRYTQRVSVSVEDSFVLLIINKNSLVLKYLIDKFNMSVQDFTKEIVHDNYKSNPKYPTNYLEYLCEYELSGIFRYIVDKLNFNINTFNKCLKILSYNQMFDTMKYLIIKFDMKYDHISDNIYYLFDFKAFQFIKFLIDKLNITADQINEHLPILIRNKSWNFIKYLIDKLGVTTDQIIKHLPILLSNKSWNFVKYLIDKFDITTDQINKRLSILIRDNPWDFRNKSCDFIKYLIIRLDFKLEHFIQEGTINMILCEGSQNLLRFMVKKYKLTLQMIIKKNLIETNNKQNINNITRAIDYCNNSYEKIIDL